MRIQRNLLVIAVALATTTAAAQTARNIRDEYGNAIHSAQTIAALGPDLFGESVNLKDGVTRFAATDVSAATNSGLTMAVGRSLGVNARDVDEYVDKAADGELFGNWALEVPVISGTFDERTGWVAAGSDPSKRCSQASPPPAVRSAFTGWNIDYYPEQYWSGNQASIPGKGEYPLLALPADRPRPEDGQNYHWTTKGDWRVSCVPTLRNDSGEGFRVVLPDGTRYTFDWMSSRKAAALKDKQCKVAYYNEYNVANWQYTYWVPSRPPLPNEYPGAPTGPFPTLNQIRWYPHRMDGGAASGGSRQVNFCQEEVVVNRREYSLHATRVEDRFGNWVAYDYDPAKPRRLRALTSSDGASITLAYGPHGKVSSVSHNGRTWQYQYASPDGAALSAVVNPDASRWTFQYANLQNLLHENNAKVRWADCEPFVPGQATGSVTIGHPGGATGVFNFGAMMHGVDRTPGSCYQPDPDKPLHVEVSSISMVYKTASLTSKQVTGPGLAAQTWSYAYFPSWSWNPNGYVDDCTGIACNSTVRTEVTAPDGSISRSVFGNDYFRNAGQLLRQETLSAGQVVQSTAYSYLANATGQPFPDGAGVDLNPRNNRLITEKIRPLEVTTIARDGDQFSNSVQLFDRFARPVRVNRHSSLGAFKEEVTEYFDHLPSWVLGQVRRQYLPATSVNDSGVGASLVAVETQYNDQAMPWKSYAFGKLRETLGYDAQGNIRTVTDGNGNTLTISDYFRGVPRLIRYPATAESPAGATISAVVDNNGWIQASIDEQGSKTCYSHDPMGRITTITYPSETQAGVCDASRWAPVTLGFQQMSVAEHGLPAGHWRQHRYEGNRHVNRYLDAFWRPVLEERLDASDVGGTLQQTVTRYDSMGRTVFVSYPQRGVGSFLDVTQGTRTRHDALGRAIQVEQDSELGPLQTTTAYLDGLRIRVTNPRGQVSITSHLAWDEPGYELPIGMVLPEGKVVQIDRHPRFGWPLRMQQRSADSSQQQFRRYVYDGNAQLCKTIEPETGATVLGYDGAGNLTWSAAGLPLADFADSNSCDHVQAYASGRRVSRQYDSRGRLTELAFPDGRGNQRWSYAADSLASSVSVQNEANGGAAVTTSYSYNKRRQLTAESVQQLGWYSWSLGYDYDSIGNLAAQTYPTGLRIDYAPNALGQATRAGSYASGAQYHPNGALKQFTYGNGVVYSMQQNARQLPLGNVSAGASHLEYGYDRNGNIEQIRDLSGDPASSGRNRTMTYDGLDRLTSTSATMFGGDGVHRFSYDALDNLKSWKLAGVKDYADYVYDPQTHRLSAIRNSLGAVEQSLSYDAQGNLQSRNGQTYLFGFDNRLREVSGTESYRYDGLGRRIQSTAANGAKRLWMYARDGRMMFSWDGTGAEKTQESVYLAGTLVASVDHQWPSNAVIATKYHHTDALGSPVAVTNASGQVIERNDYEPFGAVIGKSGFSGIGYGGHVMDGATGLTYMQQRYYDQGVGRFLSVDPVGADTGSGVNFNRYRYAANNPYSMVDPDGRQEMPTSWRNQFNELMRRGRAIAAAIEIETKIGLIVGGKLSGALGSIEGEVFSVTIIGLNGNLAGERYFFQEVRGPTGTLQALKYWKVGYEGAARREVHEYGREKNRHYVVDRDAAWVTGPGKSKAKTTGTVHNQPVKETLDFGGGAGVITIEGKVDIDSVLDALFAPAPPEATKPARESVPAPPLPDYLREPGSR